MNDSTSLSAYVPLPTDSVWAITESSAEPTGSDWETWADLGLNNMGQGDPLTGKCFHQKSAWDALS